MNLLVAEGEVRLQLKVSGSKLRVLLNSVGPYGRKPHQLIERFLAESFGNNPASHLSSERHSGYYMQGFGRCWNVSVNDARVEFWFPYRARELGDADVNEFINALLTPLNLPIAEQLPEDANFGSIRGFVS